MGDPQRLGFGEFVEDVRAVIVSPGRRFPVIHERGVLWGSLFLLIAPPYFGFAFLSGVYFDRDPFPGYAFLVPAIASLIISCGKVFCIHLVARLLEGKGRYFAATGKLRALFVLFGYTGVPSIIALLLALALLILVPGQLGYLLRNLHTVFVSGLIAIGIGLFIWNLILAVLALRSVYPMRDIKIVIAVILGPVLFAAPSMSLHLLVGSAEVDTAYLAPVLNERMMRLFAADPSSPEARPARMDVHVDRLVYRYKQPARFDLAIFYPWQDPSVKEGQKQGKIVIGQVSVGVAERKDRAVGRIIGLPGEQVEIVQGRLIINGQPWVEPYLAPEWRSSASFPATTLGPSQYLILPEDRRLLDSGYTDIVVSRDRIAGRMTINRYPLGWWLLRPTAFMKGHPEGQASTRQ